MMKRVNKINIQLCQVSFFWKLNKIQNLEILPLQLISNFSSSSNFYDKKNKNLILTI